MVGGYEDVEALWENLHLIDCFSAGADADLSLLLPVVLTLVSEGRLTLEDLVLRMHEAPLRILNLPSQPDTFVEVRVLCVFVPACAQRSLEQLNGHGLHYMLLGRARPLFYTTRCGSPF